MGDNRRFWRIDLEKRRKIIATVTNDLIFDRRMIRICRSMTSFGFDVTLVGRKLPSSGALKEEPFKQKRLKCFFNKGPFFYAEYNIRLLIYLLFSKFDAVCAVDLDTLLPAYLAAKAKEARLVYDAHEYFTEVPEVVDRKFVKKVWSVLAKMLIPRADLAYTVSTAIAEEFNRKYKKRFEVIRNVPFRTSPVPLDDAIILKQPYLLYQGALNEGRCVENYIGLVKDTGLDLVLAGEGDLSSELRQQVEKEGLTDKVTFLGWVDPDDLPKWTQGAFIGLNVLENKGLSYYYSLSNKCFDYVQAGVPLISSPFPEYKALNDQFEVMLFANAEQDEIALAVKLLASDSEKYNNLRKNCLLASEVWNWEEEIVKLRVLYNELWK